MFFIRIMSDSSFKKAIRKAEDKAYDAGYEKAKQDMKAHQEYLTELQRKIDKAEVLLEKRGRQKIIEALRDEDFFDAIDNAGYQLSVEALYEAEKENEQS